MHNEPRQQLCQLIAQYGPALSEDPRRCSALLKDHCGQYKREIFVLVNALENRVATELINASAGVPEVVLLSRLSKRLEDELGLAENAAKWAVETWALALGVIQQPLQVSAPTAVQATQSVSRSDATPVTVSSVTSAGGKLKFPRFSVGKVKIGGKELVAVGEIDVPQGQAVELRVSDDVTDFSFLETCDPNALINQICLSRCKNFNDAELVRLKKLTNLQFIDLSGCEMKGYSFNREHWMSLKIIKNLIYLDLSACGYIQNDCFEYISNFSNLRKLNLNMSNYGLGNIFVTDSGLEYLGRLTNLEVLALNKFRKITGPGVLAHLGHMTQLKTLNLSQCENVSPARLKELKQMLPNTQIFS